MIVTWAVAADAHAQPSERFPDSTTIQVNGERHEAFNLGGFAELLRIDAELAYCEAVSANLKDSLHSQEEANIALMQAVEAADAQIETLQVERTRLVSRWEDENRRRLEAENRPSIGSWVGWGLAGAFGVATLVLSLVLGVAL